MTTYFFDNCISPKLATILHVLELESVEAVHIRDAPGFDRNDDDTVWMPKVAARGWIVVTCDNAIRRKLAERLICEQVQLRVVWLAEGFARLKRLPQAIFLLKHWEDIQSQTAKCKPGDSFYAPMTSKLRRL